MTISLKHKFESAVSDSVATDIVQPSDWNDEHDLTCASNVILGRSTAGAGVVEELTPTTVRTMLSTYVESSPIEPTSMTDISYSFAHGLGAIPSKFGWWIECKVTNNGYAVGDRVRANDYRAITVMSTIMADDTTVEISFDSNFTSSTYIVPRGGGTAVAAAFTDWDIILWAEL